MFLNKLIILQILNILTTEAIMNKISKTTGNYKILQAGTFYLNSERPLWILQDQKNQQEAIKSPIKENLRDETIKTSTSVNRRQQQQLSASNLISPHGLKHSKTKAHRRLSNKGLRLPHNYIPFKKASKPNLTTSSRRYYQNSKFIENMPVFDAIPGDESFTQSKPIFIYTGNKGRMLFNTMLSRHKYPMQEPVPGQVLYPPQPLVFKPKPLVENLQRKLNVTMIPFYSYEAIEPRNQNHVITTTSSATTSTIKPAKKSKKAKQYAAFFSPEEVLSQPATDFSQYHYYIEHTTNSPPTLEKPYVNHRFHSIPSSSSSSSASTTPLPHKKFEVTYNDGEDKFQIIYEDDAAPLERPLSVQTTKSPLPYESYTFDNNYFAFPVYTMAKLMENGEKGAERLEETTTTEVSVERQSVEKLIDTALKEENDSLLDKSNEDTWFILNSRYKGPLKTKTSNLHSSKYVQTSPQDNNKKFSLYGENINII